MKNKFLLSTFLFFYSVVFLGLQNSYAQAPVNDEYTGAISLTVNGGYTCSNSVSGTTLNATKSPKEACNSNSNDDDVWFKFVATKASHIVRLTNIKNVSGSGDLRYIEVFNSLNGEPVTQIRCSGYGDQEALLISLTAGETYFVRIYTYYGNNSSISFNICILTPPAPPSNDEYTAATSLTASSGYTCTNTVSSTTNGATQSSQDACNYESTDDDVWFKFVATKASHIVRLSNITNSYGTLNLRYFEVFTSQSDVPDERIHCSSYDHTEGLLFGLTQGATYFVRVYSYSAMTDVSDRINFNICILSPPVPPSNDEYTGATALTVSSAYTCTNTVSSTTNGATQSSQDACNNESTDDDVWFKFVATKASHIVRLSNITNSYGTLNLRYFEVFTSQADAPDERIHCSSYDHTEKLLLGLTQGATYFVRVYSYSAITDISDRINFNICILTPPVPPSNDEYTGATVLTTNYGYNCTNTANSTTNGATQSSQDACNNESTDDDVWFRFVATRESHIVRLSNITNPYGTLNLRYFEIFTSQADTPDERIHCSSYDHTEKLLLGLTQGATYFVRVYSYSAVTDVSDRINFNICVLTPVTAPANDEYANATTLTINTGTECTTVTPGTTDGATKSTQEACHTDNDDDVWFKFTATQASHILRLSNIAQAYGNQNGRYIEVFATLNGAPAARKFCSDNIGLTETTLTGLIPGDSYFVRIYTYGDNGRINFNLCVNTPPIPTNNECVTAIDITGGTLTDGTTNGATQSMQPGACSSGIAYDVWYKATPVSTGKLTLTANTNDFDLVIEAFIGTCDGLTSVLCVNNGLGSESATINDAVAGVTYYYRIYNYTPINGRVAAETGTFNVQVTGPALPVTLTSFTVLSGENNSADLKWATTNETNSSHFDIQHSLNAKDWEKIGEVAAMQESTTLKTYNYTHTNLSTGINYYRLKSVDTDGTFAYSKIQSLDVENKAKQVVLYPNPVSEKLTISMDNWNEKTQIQLFNPLGQQVNATVNRQEGTVDVRKLPAGLYVIRIKQGNNVDKTYKVLISR